MSVVERVYQLWTEALPLVRLWLISRQANKLPSDETLAFCYEILNKVSRSFAIVIQQLPSELRDSVCIFYLVLRALDTVEDDMRIDAAQKVPILKQFYQHIYQRDWRFKAGTKEYARLLANYPIVTAAFLRLPTSHQQVIEDITRQMGAGMADFLERDVLTLEDYDQYCHYVAGLVGIGLSKLFCASNLESSHFAHMEALSNDMGLFLQKVNITRDYLEDITEEPTPRVFWPKEIWGQYAQDLTEFQNPANKVQAVRALNYMVCDAMRHAPSCLQYMSNVRNPQIFRFCAIPQVMAIATLAEIFNNECIFQGVVKVRRGVVARYVTGLTDEYDLLKAFIHYATAILKRSRSEAIEDPHAKQTALHASAIVEYATARLRGLHRPSSSGRQRMLLFRLLVLFIGAAVLLRAASFKYQIESTDIWVLLLPSLLAAALLTYKFGLKVFLQFFL